VVDGLLNLLIQDVLSSDADERPVQNARAGAWAEGFCRKLAGNRFMAMTLYQEAVLSAMTNISHCGRRNRSNRGSSDFTQPFQNRSRRVGGAAISASG
jgi:hypothetical protein